MTTTLNAQVYSSLLVEYQPKAIATQEEYNQALNSIDRLMELGEELSPEESLLLETLAILVEAYEDSQLPLEASSPQEVLLHLMEVRELKQIDLVDVIGSKGIVSEIVNGKRSISKAQAKALGDYFNVSPALFI
jgi:HTH-type transcriptional regulator / antitoxin HigA